VESEKEFQEKMRRLGTLVGEIDQVPAGGSKVAARELVQLLMEVHRSGLERIMELVFQTENESGMSGAAIIDRLGQDPIVRNLLLLYSLHPDDLETRVLRALDIARTRLRKFDSRLELVSLKEGAVQLRLQASDRPRGSTIRDLRAMVEGAIYDLAPDLISLTILAPEEESSSGFVPLESLLKHSLAGQGARVDGAD
jgi:hypothetical protein